MPVIEAQYLSTMVPHDHRRISQKSMFRECDVGALQRNLSLLDACTVGALRARGDSSLPRLGGTG